MAYHQTFGGHGLPLWQDNTEIDLRCLCADCRRLRADRAAHQRALSRYLLRLKAPRSPSDQ